MDTLLQGKRTLVIGGSGGIGKHISCTLGHVGAEVFVHGGHNQASIDSTVARIKKQGGTAYGFLKEIQAAEDIIPEIKKRLPIDILVVSFGPFLQNPIQSMSVSQWRLLIDLNLTLPAALISLCVPDMIKHRFGRIILFGGTGTEEIREYATTAAYSAAKTALGVIAKSSAHELSWHNITCNIICPGFASYSFHVGFITILSVISSGSMLSSHS